MAPVSFTQPVGADSAGRAVSPGVGGELIFMRQV